jgi:hypothetical protein
MLGQITTMLSGQACDAVAAVKGIPAQVRMSQNRRPASEASAFIPTILRPVKMFFSSEGPGAALKEAFMKEITNEVVEHALTKYVIFSAHRALSQTGLMAVEGTFFLYLNGRRPKNPFENCSAGKNNRPSRSSAVPLARPGAAKATYAMTSGYVLR